MTRTIALVITILSVVAVAAPDATAQDAAAQMQEALRLERSLGDYDGAIALYRRIAADDAADRRVVAQALIQLGKAYESLGRSEAFSAYDRVAREFTEQEDLVAEARTRMRGLATENPRQPARVAARQPGEMSKIPFAGDREMSYYGVDLSPDGRYMALTGGFYQDLQTGLDTEFETAEDCRLSTVRFSPDGSTLAYGCFGNAGAGVIDLASGVATRFLDADDYFGAEGGHSVEVFDWTRDGSSVLIAIETSEGDDRITNHLILQPVKGGIPTIVDPDYAYDGHVFWENNACLMRDDQFVFGDWQLWLGRDNGIRQLYVQRISVLTQERENVLFATGRGYMLMGCDKRANILYYQETLSDERTFLWSAMVDEYGRLVGQKRLLQLPASVFVHPITQDGNLYYTPWGTNPWRRSWFGEIQPDSGIAHIAGSAATGFIFDWSNDGRYRMGMNPYSSRWVLVTDTDTGGEANIDLGHMPMRWGFLPDDRVMLSHSSDKLTRTWIFDIGTGSPVDSIDGQLALGIMPDGESLVFADSTGGNVCLVSMRLADRSVTPFTCLEKARPSLYAGLEFSRDGRVAWVGYLELDGDRVARVDRVFALDGSMDQIIDFKGRGVELLPDGSGAFLIGERTLDLLDFASGVETPFDPGLAEGYSVRSQKWKLHPDGTRFETWLTPPPERDLTVIHNVKGLLEDGN